MRLALLATLLILLAGSPVAAQTGPQTGPWAILDVMAAETCDEATAAPVSFEVAATVSSECVSVEGLMQGNALFDGIEGYYRANMGRRSDATPYRIGVYGLADVTPRERPRPARLTGRSGQCQDLYEPDVDMVVGYCHSAGGPFVALGEMKLLGRTPERLTGQTVRARLGLLVEPEPDWSQRAYVEARARHWLSLARGDDPAAYAEAAELSGYALDLDDPDSELHIVFRARGTVFERLRAEPSPSMKMWRISQSELDPYALAIDPGDVQALVCFRLGAWQDDRWPVAPVDADNNDARPFACVTVVTWTQTEVIEYYSVRYRGSGLAEPVAFRD